MPAAGTYYVQADTIVTKVSGANGTGFKVGTNTYYAYGVESYGWIAQNDGDGNDALVTLTPGQVKVTVIDQATNAPQVYAVAYNPNATAISTWGLSLTGDIRIGSKNATTVTTAYAHPLNTDVVIYDNY